MGDLNSVDISQTTHECILNAAGCLAADCKLEYGSPVPKGKVWEGVYVDDYLIIGIVDKHLVEQKSGPDYELLCKFAWDMRKLICPLQVRRLSLCRNVSLLGEPKLIVTLV